MQLKSTSKFKNLIEKSKEDCIKMNESKWSHVTNNTITNKTVTNFNRYKSSWLNSPSKFRHKKPHEVESQSVLDWVNMLFKKIKQKEKEIRGFKSASPQLRRELNNSGSLSRKL